MLEVQKQKRVSPFSSKLFSRLIAFAAAFLVFALLFGSMFQMFESISMQAMLRMNEEFSAQASTISDSMQSIINTLGIQMFYISSTAKLRKSTSLTQNERVFALRELWQYAMSGSMLHSIYVFNPKLDYVYTTDNDYMSASMDGFYDQDAVALYRQRSPENRMRLYHRTFRENGEDYGSEWYSYLVYEVTASGKTGESAVMLNLNADWFREHLLNFQGENYVIVSSDSYVVASQREELNAMSLSLLGRIGEQKRGYLLTKTPLMAKSDLYKISGHWDHYLDGMFVLGDPNDDSKECFALRPMTCPFQYQVFLNRGRSYRDLPMRLGETSTLFRNEDSGEMHGLIRVRQFTISEGHLILRPDQLEDEFRGCLELAKYLLGTVGMLDNCSFRFSQWDPNNTEKYIGTPEQWDEAQSTMAKILDDLGVNYTIGIDEAAFYGPKLDIQYKNVFGKEDTIVTIQVDQLLAEQFGMEYIDQEGKKVRPYIIHRTSLGCYERTLAYLIELYAGALPTWMAPEQVRFLPVTDRAADYCAAQAKKLEALGYRVTVDYRNEKTGKKIRDAQLEKVPYMVVVGDRDIENNTVSPRHRADGDLGAMSMDAFTALLKEVVDSKSKK